MKKTKTCLLIYLLTIYFTGYAQNSAIRGIVKTSDNYYATDLTISLNDSLRTKVASDGTYIFKNLNPGQYVIATTHVGLQSERDTLFLKPGETLQFDFHLAVNNHALKEVVVDGFKRMVEPEVSSSLRVQTPVLELPQNVQIVNAEVLAKQQIFNLADGLIRNVSGVSRLAHWNDMYVNIHMRGSQIQAFRNGMNVVSSFWSPLSEDMAVVDRVEFVKGPAGFMMSSGDPAGIYNVVTKKPTGIEKGEVTFALGSFNSYRSTLDLDGVLSKDQKLLYRLNIAADTKGSFRPFEDNKRLVLAPVLSYQLDDKTKATFEYTYQKAKMSDIGSSYVMSPFGYKSLPRDMTFSSEGLEPLDVNEHSAFATLEHQLSKNWKLTAQAAYFAYDQIGASSWPLDIYPDGKVIRKSDIWDATSTMAMGQFFVNGKVQTGTVEHKILAGLDLGDKKYYADWNTSFVLDSVNGGEFDPLDPDYTFDFTYQPFDRSIPIKTRGAEGGGTIASHYTSVYVQDELGFFEDALRLTLAARFTNMSQASWGDAPIESKKVTPRVGLSYSIDKSTSVYGLYDQAFLPQNGFLTSGSEIKPITGNINELGLKRDWFGGRLNTSISAYQLIKNNEITSYGPQFDMTAEIGQKKVKGIEFDLRGQILPGFNAIANYAYTDGKITKVNEEVADIYYVGQRLDGADKHIANLWLDYTLLKGDLQGLSFRAGMTTYIDRATQFYSNEHPEWNIEDYWRFDAGLGYQRDHFTVTLNVQNVLDRYLLLGGSYYTDYFASAEVYSWQADLPRNFRLSFSYRF